MDQNSKKWLQNYCLMNFHTNLSSGLKVNIEEKKELVVKPLRWLQFLNWEKKMEMKKEL